MSQKITFHVPFIAPETQAGVNKVLDSKNLAGNNVHTKSIHQFFSEQFGFMKSFFVHSASLALQMAAILCDLKDGDEVLVPSYSYVTTASSFLMNGSKIVFCDCEPYRPHIEPNSIRQNISSRTKALVVMHYGGISCNMKEIVQIAKEHNLLLIEDCAHAIGSREKSRPLGTYGDISVFSFQQSKNVQCGEGGLLVVNNLKLQDLADLIWNEGTNKSEFDKGNISHYEWVSKGSSYQPSDLMAVTLATQLPYINKINERILFLWNRYYKSLKEVAPNYDYVAVPQMGNSVHGFYIVCESIEQLSKLKQHLNLNGVASHSHYTCLHQSPYWSKIDASTFLPNAEFFAGHLLRLPLYYDLNTESQDQIIDLTKTFFQKKL